MGKPYSMDLCGRVVAYVEAGHSCRAARLFRVSASMAVGDARVFRSSRSRDLVPSEFAFPPGETETEDS